MNNFTITIQDQAVQSALKALADRATNLQPVMAQIGERMMEDTKRRFETSTGPDGQRWQANSAATLQALSDRLGKSYRTKSGALNTKGAARLANKKPLIDKGDLRRQFVLSVGNDSLTLSNTMAYAVIHQFGGQAGRGHKTTIPARPFLPVKPDGTLYPQEQAAVLDELNNWLINGR